MRLEEAHVHFIRRVCCNPCVCMQMTPVCVLYYIILHYMGWRVGCRGVGRRAAGRRREGTRPHAEVRDPLQARASIRAEPFPCVSHPARIRH